VIIFGIYWEFKMKFLNTSLLAAAVLTSLVSSASATVVVAGAGWVEGVILSAGGTSTDSPLTFTVAAGQTDLFSLSDAFQTGDVWTVTPNSGSALFTTTQTNVSARVANFPNIVGDDATYDAAWTNGTFGHLQLVLGAGTYSINVTGNGAGGIPAHFGYRLDVSAVPEPSTWAMMILGFLGLGFVAYRRKNGTLRLA
jgi:hypothetical protein